MTRQYRVRILQTTILLMVFLILAFGVSARADDYLLKVVYIVPYDREPHTDYDVRLDYIIKKLQQFFSDTLETGGYVDGSSQGKTFQFEADTGGDLIVHLIDHSPDGNHPNSNRTLARYLSGQVNQWEDIANHLPSDFFTQSAVVILVDQSSVSVDHYLRDAPQGGAGESGPGQDGYVVGTDHFFGNDLTYTMDDPPIQFDVIGRNDTEQLAIFKDSRLTNIKMGPISWRPAPPSWNPGEHPSQENLLVWEYATITIGALFHEIGHAFALPHTLRYTEGNTPGVYGDFNIMGNGFRRIYRSLFPEEPFPVSQQYPRLSTIYDEGFNTGAIYHPVQWQRLNRNQFFNPGAVFSDFERPTMPELEVSYNPVESALKVGLTAQDFGPSGLSHITYLLDWNAHQAEEIPEASAFLRIRQEVSLNFTPQEYAGLAFSRGIHALTAEAMDREGNIPTYSDCLYYYGIGDGYLQHWMIFSKYFDSIAIVGSGASFQDKLTHAYFPTPDAQLDPHFRQRVGDHSWCYRKTGAYLSVTDKIPKYFIDPPASGGYHCVCYAATRLISNRVRPLFLHFGYNDFLQVFLNGEQVYLVNDFTSGRDPFSPLTIPVTLQQGENLLLVKHFNDWSYGGFWICFRELGGVEVDVEPYPPADPDTLSVLVPRQTGFSHWSDYR